MKHISEEDLILQYYGEADAADAEAHLAECGECRSRYNLLRLVLNSMNGAAVPERPGDYGNQVWKRIGPKLRRGGRWAAVFQPRWWALIPAMAALLLAAFFAGRISKQANKGMAAVQVRERILLVAVGDHLDRSQMVLAELSNASDGKGTVDISEERQLAEDLLEDNRLYRQTAHKTGDANVAGILDDLERVLLEIAHSPAEISNEQLGQLRQEIQDRGLLFKVQIIGSQVRRREGAADRKGTKL